MKSPLTTHAQTPPSYKALGDTKAVEEMPLELQSWWMRTHFLGFFCGGTTFILGTLCYFYPEWEEGGLYADMLYTLGSCGFLYVDVLEFFTFTDDFLLRCNITMSATGSTFYVIGSVGFLPVFFNESATCGELGFIAGSAFIGVSQSWKVLRLSRSSLRGGPCASKDTLTAIGVEAGAMIGAFCFLLGTIMFAHGPVEGAFYQLILTIWVWGSCAFTMGSFFLGYRHFLMGV